jgi:pimeloyl-ACP methyl ester carboxylesterase
MLQHGTQIYRDYAPSLFLDKMWKYLQDPSQVSNWAEAIVGYMYAHAGYVVVMADYPGIGISQAYHPYMDPRIAHCVTDLFAAIQTRLGSSTWKSSTVWNNQLFLIGYSEGSYATVQAAREFQAGGVTVTAVAAMDGPHDLSTTMRQVMIANHSSPSPYFLPYTLVSFEHIQGDASFGYTQTMVSPYCTTLPPMMNGDYTSDQVTAAMPTRSDSLVYPVDILTSGFIAELSKPYTGVAATDGPAVTALAANDSYRGWSPAMPLRLFHCATDDLVPVGNSQAALAAWTGLSNVSGIIGVTPLSLPGESVHVEAAIPAYLGGFQWLDTFRQ